MAVCFNEVWALLWTILRQSCSLSNLFRDSASRAGGGLRGLQTDGMVSEYRNDVYHSSHLLRESNVIVNQCTIHLRRAKPITCNRSLNSIYEFGKMYFVLPYSFLRSIKQKEYSCKTVLSFFRCEAPHIKMLFDYALDIVRAW